MWPIMRSDCPSCVVGNDHKVKTAQPMQSKQIPSGTQQANAHANISNLYESKCKIKNLRVPAHKAKKSAAIARMSVNINRRREKQG